MSKVGGMNLWLCERFSVSNVLDAIEEGLITQEQLNEAIAYYRDEVVNG